MKNQKYIVWVVLLFTLFSSSLFAGNLNDAKQDRAEILINDKSKLNSRMILAGETTCELSACLAKCDDLEEKELST